MFEGKLTIPYAKGLYNKIDDNEQWIRITEGCPNGCPFCAETYENGKDPIYYEIPEIVRNKVKIMDMNLIYKPKALDIIWDLGERLVNKKVVYYELVCGIDYRYMTPKHALALKSNRFVNIRLAWDWGFSLQKRIKETIKMLTDVGYKNNDITVFVVCNWRIPYIEQKMKMDLCKVWNVKMADCYFDNQLSPNIKPIYWTKEEIKKFRRAVRKHNQLVNFKIDPEYKQDKLI